jgi:hypothetical protein
MRHFKVSVFAALAAALKAGEITVEGSIAYSDYHEQVPGSECEAPSRRYCQVSSYLPGPRELHHAPCCRCWHHRQAGGPCDAVACPRSHQPQRATQQSHAPCAATIGMGQTLEAASERRPTGLLYQRAIHARSPADKGVLEGG